MLSAGQTIIVNGTASIILDRPLAQTHINGTIETTKPLRFTILRDEMQVVADRSLVDIETIDFVADPDKNYTIKLQSETETYAKITLNPYLKATNYAIFPSDSLEFLNHRMMKL